MLIEYFGLSGSGKSYLSKKLSEEEDIPIVEVSGKWKKLFHALSFVFAHPVFFIYTTSKIARESNKSFQLWRHKYFSLFFSAIANEHKARKMRSAIITDGLYQFALALFEQPVTAREMEKYITTLRRIPRRTLYLVQTDEETRKRRMQDRKRIPRSKFGFDYAENFQEVLKHNVETLKNITQDKVNFIEN